MEKVKVVFMILWIFIELPFRYLWGIVSKHPVMALAMTLITAAATLHFYYDMAQLLILLIPAFVAFLIGLLIFGIYKVVKSEKEAVEYYDG